MAQDILLIVGNGLTIDFMEDAQIKGFDSRKVFRWDVDYPGKDNEQFLSEAKLPNLFKYYQSVFDCLNDSYICDYDIIEGILSACRTEITINNNHHELKQCVEFCRQIAGILTEYEKERKIKRGERGAIINETLADLYRIISDFELKIIMKEQSNSYMRSIQNDKIREFKKIQIELCHYINYAYATLQKYLNSAMIIQKKNSEFKSWISNNFRDIAYIISYNYELALENTLESLEIPYFRIGTDEEDETGKPSNNSIPIWKPHGSIDFASNFKIKPELSSYPLKRFASLNEDLGKLTPILDEDNWFTFREEVDIVLPTQSSDMITYAFNRKGWEKLNTLKDIVKQVYVFGLSYWPGDRYEIDRILIDNNWKINIVNPNPPGVMFAKYAALKKEISVYNSFSEIK